MVDLELMLLENVEDRAIGLLHRIYVADDFECEAFIKIVAQPRFVVAGTDPFLRSRE